jgi:hypothetical protein
MCKARSMFPNVFAVYINNIAKRTSNLAGTVRVVCYETSVCRRRDFQGFANTIVQFQNRF